MKLNTARSRSGQIDPGVKINWEEMISEPGESTTKRSNSQKDMHDPLENLGI